MWLTSVRWKVIDEAHGLSHSPYLSPLHFSFLLTVSLPLRCGDPHALGMSVVSAGVWNVES